MMELWRCTEYIVNRSRCNRWEGKRRKRANWDLRTIKSFYSILSNNQFEEIGPVLACSNCENTYCVSLSV